MAFNNASHIDASHSTFNEVHGNQYVYKYDTFERLEKAIAPGAAHNSHERSPALKCIQGTRVDLLSRLTSWIDDPSQKPICWLNGKPGSGKSAISQTIAEMYTDRKRLAASFFFSRDDDKRRTTCHVFPTLTMQFIDSLPSIRQAVSTVLETDHMIQGKVLREQMEKLLLGPVSTATEAPPAPLLIVIDALDECDNISEFGRNGGAPGSRTVQRMKELILELLGLLALFLQKVPLPLRLLVTSRSEAWLQSGFQAQNITSLTLSVDIHSFNAEDDIRLFMRDAFDKMYHEHSSILKNVRPPWPSPDKLDQLINKARGQFIVASAVVKFIGAEQANLLERVQDILQDTGSLSTGSEYEELDRLYLKSVLSFPYPEAVRSMLSIICCSATPLPMAELQRLFQPLLPRDIDVREIFSTLGSVFLSSDDSKPIRFHHPSFRDFLASQQRSHEYRIAPDLDGFQKAIARQCLDTMSDSLKPNMHRDENPILENKEAAVFARRPKAAFNEGLSYACRFWPRHLALLPKGGVAGRPLLDALKRFNTTPLLYWEEALGILGELENVSPMLHEAITWLKTLQDTSEEVLTPLEDAQRRIALQIAAPERSRRQPRELVIHGTKPSVTSPVTPSKTSLCVACHAKPKYFDGKKTHPYCSKTCAHKMCDYCHEKPKYDDGRTTYPFCSRNCAQEANALGTVDGPPPKLLKNGCLLCGKAATEGLFCSKTCTTNADDKAPLLIEVHDGHDAFQSVADQFKTSWREGISCPKVNRVYKVIEHPSFIAKYEAYKASVEARGKFVATGRSPGNENRRWHGTKRECHLGDNGNTTLCSSTSCALCNIIRTSYALNKAGRRQFGKGIYTSSTSSKSDFFSRNVSHSAQKALLLNKVVIGKGYMMTQHDNTLTAPPEGYDSVLAEVAPGGAVNWADEVICYTQSAIIPSYLIIYDAPRK